MKKVAVFLHDKVISGADLSLIDCLSDNITNEYELFVVVPRMTEINTKMLNKVKISNDHIIAGHYAVIIKNDYKPRGIIKKIREFIRNVYALVFNNIMLFFLRLKLKKIGISLIHSNSFVIYFGGQIAEKMSIPHVWHIREFVGYNHEIKLCNENKIKRICSNSYAIFISDVIKEEYLNNFSFIDYKVIYDKINFDDSYIKTRKFMEDKICNTLYVGALNKNKGILELIDCIKEIKEKNYNINLTICGSGELYDFINKKIKKDNLYYIKMLGYRTDINDIRKQMDIAFMCSNNEALGRTTIEAQYYQNIIIGAITKYNCARYLIEDGVTGFLYNKSKNGDLYDKIVYAMEHKDKCDIILKSAKKKSIQRFSKPIIGRIYKYYDEILKIKKS